MKRFSFLVLMCLISFQAFAQTTSSLPIQGILKDGNGDPLTGAQSISITVESPGFTDFTTTLSVTANDDGFYTASILGIPTELFEANTQIIVNGETINYHQAPYSQFAKVAKEVDGIQVMNQINFGSSKRHIISIICKHIPCSCK